MAGIYRRGKTYWARAQRQGREYRRSLKTKDRATAERRIRTWLEDLEAIAWGDKPRRSFDDTAERFVNEHLVTLKPRSAERYGSSLKHLALHFGGKMLHQITSSELSAFETKRRTEGVRPGTIRRDLSCLSSMLTSAIDWEWVDDGANPVPSYMRRRAKRGLKEAPPRTRYLSEDEERRLLEVVHPLLKLAIILTIDTGLRREELFSLKWDQVDQRRGVIKTTTLTKSGRMRFVPLQTRSAQLLAHLPRYLHGPYVICHADGTRYWQLNKAFTGALRRANVRNARWHDLRRTAGCRWLQRDRRSMAEVSIMLGHSSIAVTETRYAFLEGEQVAESVGRGVVNEIA